MANLFTIAKSSRRAPAASARPPKPKPTTACPSCPKGKGELVEFFARHPNTPCVMCPVCGYWREVADEETPPTPAAPGERQEP